MLVALAGAFVCRPRDVGAPALAVVAGRHGEAVAEGQPPVAVRHVDPRGQVAGREQVEHRLVEREPSLVDEQPDRSGGEGLAQRVDQLDALGGVGRPPSARDDLAVPGDQEAVRVVTVRLEGVNEGEEAEGIDALGRGRAGG